ncbi:MAG: peptidoglycan DD-metalloendopeptidase family protein [Symbiobacteriia bacterium]
MPQIRTPIRRLVLVGAILALAAVALLWRHYAGSRVVGGLQGRADVLSPGTGLVAPAGEVPATVITVAGIPVVPVADQATAEAVISSIEAAYRQRLDPKASIRDLSIKEQVSYQAIHTQPGAIRTAEEAQRILARGTDKLLNYTVQRGDSLWQIATTHGMTVETLSKANPEVNPAALQPGQELNLLVAEPYVHLQSVEEVTVVENIAFETVTIDDPSLYPWQSAYDVKGVFGRREVTYLTKREDGRLVDRQVKAEKLLSPPAQATFRQGTKLAPKLGSGKFQLPVIGKLTSGFGWRGSEYHPGIDLAVPFGTPVMAADGGTVVYAGWLGGYGRCVQIDHGEGKLVTLYGHLQSFSVKVGQTVKKGEVIAYSGNSGRSTGPHVHFEIRRDGKATNPMQFFPD